MNWHDQIDYWTTSIMEDHDYVTFSSYWDELFTTGFFPIAIIIFFNVKIYSKVQNTLLLTIHIFELNRKCINYLTRIIKVEWYYNIDSWIGQNEIWKIYWNRKKTIKEM